MPMLRYHDGVLRGALGTAGVVVIYGIDLLEGMDLHEHGTAAYHVEFGQGMTDTTPAALPFNGSHSEVLSEEPVPAGRAED